MPPTVKDTYRKDTHHSPGQGYGRNIGSAVRPIWVADRGVPLSSVVVHTTSNPQKGTKIWNECTFIRDSPDVSCHDVIGKDGTIYAILPPEAFAWHAGAAVKAFTNAYSYGIELHVSVGETPTQAQIESLTWRVKQLIDTYKMAAMAIQTHRAIALPGPDIRKHDPEGWNDTDFYAWRDRLFLPTEPNWQDEWGYAVPYHKDFAIPAAWRDAYRKHMPLGSAITDELSVEHYTAQCFERGYVLWTAEKGAIVREWNA